MLKQAILITAYKNLHHLKKLVNQFDDSYKFFIHIDRKSILNSAEIAELQATPNVVLVSRKFRTNWAGLNHVRAILHLIEGALTRDVDYIHLISGHDFPIKGPDHIRNFLLANKGKEFMENFELPTTKWTGGGIDRLIYYHLYDQLDAKTKYKSVINYLLVKQKKLGIRRGFSKDFPKLYGGSTWWTLSAECLRFVIKYLEENPWYMKRFKFTFCPEEAIIPTIIMNSPFSKNVVNDHLRYIDWTKRNGNLPANLDETDLELLNKSKQLFARKFEYPISSKLVESIEYRSSNSN